MQFPTIISAGLFFASSALSANHTLKGSTSWVYGTACGYFTAPSDFKAFNLENCTAQLTFSKDWYENVQWAFDAVYPDQTDVITHAPDGDSSENFGISDTFDPYMGNNFLTRFPSDSNYTAVFEFTNVCNAKGAPPSAWYFYTTSSNTGCTAEDYRFSTEAIGVYKYPAIMTRPLQPPNYSILRTSDQGDFTVEWDDVPDVANYSIIMQVPQDISLWDVDYEYYGERVPAGGNLSLVINTGTQGQNIPRSVVVHTVDKQGVWSLTTDAAIKEAEW